MTPKQKAEELIAKMTRPINDDYYVDYNDYAKECALIAVDEIIKALPPFEYGLEFVAKIEFWNKVKKEIEAL